MYDVHGSMQSGALFYLNILDSVMWSTVASCSFNRGAVDFLILAIVIGCCGYIPVQHIRLILKAVSPLTLFRRVSLHPPGGDAAAEALWSKM